MDVTPKTVRHYMVEHGIHEPDAETDDSSESADDGSPREDEIAAEIADAVDLPDDVTLGEITEAVCTAKTLYEVQRELGVDRDHIRRVLTELNLLEFVHGRVSTTPVQSKSREAVERRIRDAVSNL